MALIGALLSVPVVLVTTSTPTQAAAASTSGLVFDYDTSDPNGFNATTRQINDLSNGNRLPITLPANATWDSTRRVVTFNGTSATMPTIPTISGGWTGLSVSAFANFGSTAENYEALFWFGHCV